ncbi:unnamed protein product [Trichobilharzia regenti]|nr:unnamed protein product [Trichobilharzia regenti]
MCIYCPSDFATPRGLPQHLRQIHPAEYNEVLLGGLLNDRRTRRSWSQNEELTLLMLADAAVDRFNSKAELYQHQHDHLPHRSVEAIKRRLQTLKWMAFVPSSTCSTSTIGSYSTPSSPASSHESYATRSALYIRSRPETWSAQEDTRLISTSRCLDSPSLTPKQFFALVSETIGNRTTGAVCKRLYNLKWRRTLNPSLLTIVLTSTTSYRQIEPSTLPTDVFTINRSICAPTGPCRTTSTPTVIISSSMPTQLKEQRALQFAVINYYTVFDESTQSMQIAQYHYAISTVNKTILYSPTAVARTSSPTPNFEREAQRQIMPTTRLTQDGLTPLVNMTLHRSLRMDNIRANPMAAINTQLANSSQRLETESTRQIFMQLYANDITLEETRQLLDEQSKQLFPTRWKPSKQRYVSGLPSNLNNKKRRRILCAHMQTLFHRSPKDAANKALYGRWRDSFTCQPSAIGDFNEFWIEAFTRPALPDTKPVQEHLPINNDLIAPVSTEEIKWALKEMVESAAGVDGITATDLQKKKPQ